ncbi:MAG: GNAT family N-acetyltransferase [Solirubrobacterales bacterium]
MDSRDSGVARAWRAGEDELGDVARLICEFRDHWGKSEPSLESIRQSAGRILSAGDGEYLLGAVGAAQAAGVAQLRFRWSVWTAAEDCWLEDLFVRADARGAGVGRALVEACFERASERGCKRIELDTNEDNEAAIALYEACGFSTRPKGPNRTLFLSRKL